jgi:limonene-1,2-epoxide hydrolase
MFDAPDPPPGPSSIDTVRAWLAAVNTGDVEAALALTAPDVAIVGPRGVGRGHAVLRAWMGHAGATFATRAAYARGDAVVIAQHGVWRDLATAAVVGEADVATRFVVRDAQVAELERYADLTAALVAAALSLEDGQPSDPDDLTD